jgi:tetratricopeptide (TPR) repeat protein
MDASAHYLLGTLYFSRGLTDGALAEWDDARRLNPQIEVLHASLGRALLHAKNDPEQALNVFQEGTHSDPRNVELYIGIDQALSILRRPPQERVAALERYPDPAKMPSHLIYELILNLSEAGDYDKAVTLFHNRFFQREEGGTNVRQVWLEVQLQRAILLAEEGKCSGAVSLASNIANPVPDLVFTHDGLEILLASARTNYLLGSMYKRCNLPEKAEASFRRAAGQSGLENAFWSWRASQEMPEGRKDTARGKLEETLQRARSAGEISSRTGWWLYNAAMLDRAAGRTLQAQREFQDALLFPDQMLTYHLTRLALAEKNP